MADAIEYRLATSEDVPVIDSLLASMYKRRRSEEFLRWQFFNTTVPSVLICGFSGKELIGMFGIQKRRLVNGLLCGQASWLNIAPGWQGKGFFARLGERAVGYFSDLDILCVFANARARHSCEKAVGLQTIGVLKMMTLNAADVASSAASMTRCQPISGRTVFPESHAQSKGAVMFRYTPEYRSWRYATNPMHSYSLVTTGTGDFAVVKLFSDPTRNMRFGDIVDFECPLHDREGIKRLLWGASGHLKEQGAGSIATWAVPGTGVHAAVRAVGFREDAYETYFGFRALKANCEYLRDFSQWHLRLADATNF